MKKIEEDIIYDNDINGTDEEYPEKKGKGSNLIARIVCLFAAFLIWLYVMNVESPDHEEVFRSLGVSLENASVLKNEYGISVVSGTGNVADITIKGKKSELGRYSAEDIKVYVDLSEITETGRHKLDIKVEAPAGLVVTDIAPGSIEVYVDNDTTKNVRVLAKASSYTLDASYELGELVPEVTEIIVRGPAQTLELIDHALVDFNLGTVSETIVSRGALQLVDVNGEIINDPYLKLSTSDMLVTIPVYTYKEVPLVAEYKYGFFNQDNTDIQISPSTIEIKGDPKALEEINDVTIVTVDEKKISGDYFDTLQINLPEGITAVTSDKSATITIKHKGTDKRALSISDFEVINPKNYEYEIVSSLNVILRAPTNLLSYLTPEYITVTVDLTHVGATTGLINVPVSVTVDSAIEGKVYEVGDYRVQLELK